MITYSFYIVLLQKSEDKIETKTHSTTSFKGEAQDCHLPVATTVHKSFLLFIHKHDLKLYIQLNYMLM